MWKFFALLIVDNDDNNAPWAPVLLKCVNKIIGSEQNAPMNESGWTCWCAHNSQAGNICGVSIELSASKKCIGITYPQQQPRFVKKFLCSLYLPRPNTYRKFGFTWWAVDQNGLKFYTALWNEDQKLAHAKRWELAPPLTLLCASIFWPLIVWLMWNKISHFGKNALRYLIYYITHISST